MSASQVVERSDGSTRRLRGVGSLRFERSPDHSHWHYIGFMVYELRRASDNKLIGPDVKTGFCLGIAIASAAGRSRAPNGTHAAVLAGLERDPPRSGRRSECSQPAQSS